MASEKRLIDAKEYCIELYRERDYPGRTQEFMDAIEVAIADLCDMPTVEAVEVVHGRWIVSGCGFDCCSECRKVYTDGYYTAMGIKPRAQFNYCPNCGAKMDGDVNE